MMHIHHLHLLLQVILDLVQGVLRWWMLLQAQEQLLGQLCIHLLQP
jgi:hypothetical protein